MIEKVEVSAPVFAANSAQPLRFGQVITGNDVGQHLLGVSYQSMSAIEQTYDALGQCSDFRHLSAEIDVSMLLVFQVQI